MCGIYGFVSKEENDLPYKKFTDTLSHRGPDDGGYYRDEYVALGHRRLSIIDLEGGHQPLFNNDNSIAIVFNGEIYNYLDIRKVLQERGYNFRTKSDTETILYAYEEWGEECVHHLRGMFAFSIWDKKEQSLFIARDRVGIKPLFYAEHEGVFYFSSELKAIIANNEFPRNIDEKAVASYFTLSYIPAPLTIYSGIKKLLPGHTITWKQGEWKISKYWDLHFSPDRARSEADFIEEFMDVFKNSTDCHLISDVPLGAFLSGGVDSSAVVAAMSKVSADPVNTFCMGFGGNTGGYLDERKYAKEVSEAFGTLHKEYEIVPKLDGLLNKIVNAFDEPFADDSSIPSYFVSEIARQNVKVALSGLGGDELFAGYERYLGFKMQSLYNKVPLFMRNSIIPGIVNRLPERADGHYTINHIKRFVRGGCLSPEKAYMSYISMMGEDLRYQLFNNVNKYREYINECEEHICSHFTSENVEGDNYSIDRALYCDIKTYLPDDILALTDRISMHHGLEVRVPFVDHEVMEFCAKIPPEIRLKGFKKKYLLKKAMTGILPDDVINHRKQGFVGPTATWIKNDLREYIVDILSENNIKKHGIINSNTVQKILNEHFTGKNLHDKLIWSLVIFQKWYEMNIEGTTAEAVIS